MDEKFYCSKTELTYAQTDVQNVICQCLDELLKYYLLSNVVPYHQSECRLGIYDTPPPQKKPNNKKKTTLDFVLAVWTIFFFTLKQMKKYVRTR